MATAVKRTSRQRRPGHGGATELNDAVMQLLRAIPVDHLDRRLSTIEKWLGRLETDVARLVADVGGGPAGRRAHHAAAVERKPAARPRRIPIQHGAVTTQRRVHHLPVESEMARGGG